MINPFKKQTLASILDSFNTTLANLQTLIDDCEIKSKENTDRIMELEVENEQLYRESVKASQVSANLRQLLGQD